ncbi:hypothetical protein [Chryseobacterium indologenes]|uniref:Uncharacterized protein n=1 Tax=Chryseobacterium indologenes TaxID=253 RepID=A0A0N0ZU34_CHRID|nr:hypothetical protein [Chryseobacterium indologenes]KPE48946.1 hypothetical protein AOB46_22650 [Chryseobacterium indologenes]
MKKVLAILSLTACSLGYAQKGPLILNNYSAYEFRGIVFASNESGTNCYPYVTSQDPNEIIVPADSHVGNGKALIYDNYQSQFTNSLYPVTTWTVSLSSTSITPRPWNHPSLLPTGVISTNTRWSGTKFRMFYPGTNDTVWGFGGPLVLPNSCYNAPDNFTTPDGNSAEIFTITADKVTTTYIQLY